MRNHASQYLARIHSIFYKTAVTLTLYSAMIASNPEENMFENVTLPKELLPQDGRFCSGPSLVKTEFVEELAKIAPHYLGTSHRQSTVKNHVGNTIKLLRSYLNIPADYKVAMGNGSASLVWDMVTFALTEKKSIHFTNGEFSNKWFKSANGAPWVEAKKVEAKVGTLPEIKEHEGYDVHCATLNETSTGVMMNEIPKLNNSLLAIDATSVAGAINVDLSKVDLFYFSPQKAFGSEGGLWIGIFSPRALARIDSVKKSGRYIPAMLDFQTAIENGEKNQTYNTPSLGTIFLLEKSLEWFNKQGLAKIHEQQVEKAKLLDDWVERRSELSQYVQDESIRSLSVRTINIQEDVPYTDLTKRLREFGILDIDCYRKLGENQLRIAFFPLIAKSDIEKLIQCIDYMLDHR